MNQPPSELDVFLNAPREDAARAAYIDKACGGDAALRARVEALFEADRTHGGAMDRTAVKVAARDRMLPEEREGSLIGNYQLGEQIGHGGFGVVYRANQLRPLKREVALKIIKLGMDTRQVVARFEAERQALALMDHPHIAKVLDAGATDAGRPYFVMELVRGVPITDYCATNGLGLAARLDLFRAVCRAVEHAHQKGIIHRDLKPSNVLVMTHDGNAVPKVIDFGVAKATQQDLTERTIHTRQEQVIGTPAYMSPEQSQSGGLDVDTRSDIYSLGVLLYELLTGTTPFDAGELAKASQEELRRIIQDVEPLRPSTRRTTIDRAAEIPGNHHALPVSIPRELDWIVMKALEKERTRRYPTANGLADDVARFLANEPVMAAAPSVRYRAAKYIRRHRAGLSVAAAIALLLVAGSIVSLWQMNKAIAAEKQAADNAWLAKHQRVDELLGSGKTALGVAILAQMLRDDPGDRVAASRVISVLTQRDLPRQLLPDLHSANATYLHAQYSPDGAAIATGDEGGSLQIWDATTGLPAGGPMQMPPEGWIKALAFGPGDSPSASLIAVAHMKGLDAWDWRNQKHQFSVPSADPSFVTFSPDGSYILTRARGGQTVWLVDAATGDYREAPARHGGLVTTVAFLPDGTQFVSAGTEGQVWFWDTAKVWNGSAEATIGKPLEHSNALSRMALSPDGHRVAVGLYDGGARIWNLPPRQDGPTPDAEPSFVAIQEKHGDRVNAVAFSPDSERIVTASQDRTARVWDARTGHPVTDPLHHDDAVWVARFNQDGSQLVTGSSDGTAQLWEVSTGRAVGEPFRHDGKIESASISPDGKSVLTAGSDGIARVWEVRRPHPQSMTFWHSRFPYSGPIPDKVGYADISPDGNWAVTGGIDGTARFWNLRRGTKAVPPLQAGDVPTCVRFSDDGRRVLATSIGGQPGTRVWDLEPSGDPGELTTADRKGRLYRSGDTRFAEISPDGQLLATASQDGIARVWKLDTPDPQFEWEHPARLTKVRFDPHPGKPRLATACADGCVRIWNTETGELLHLLEGHEQAISELAYSKDGQFLASASLDHTVRLWNPENGNLVRTFELPSLVLTLAFDHEGSRLAAGSADGTGRIWDLKTGTRIGVDLRHAKAIESIRFSPDGEHAFVATASRDGTARIWDVPSGLPVSDPLRHDGGCFNALFTPDGTQLFTTADDTTARVWDVPRIDGPAPAWFMDFAEAVVGLQVDPDGASTNLAWEARREHLPAGVQKRRDDVFSKTAAWFTSEARPRPISPFQPYTLEDYARAALDEPSIASLEAAARVWEKREPLIMAARKLREQNWAGLQIDEWRQLRTTLQKEIRGQLLGSGGIFPADPDSPRAAGSK